MSKLFISFKSQNIRVGNSAWLFKRREKMRFEWLALLALRCLANPGEQRWVSLKDIGRLPSWAGKSNHHIATNVGRYLQNFDKGPFSFVEAEARWGGPYRLTINPLSIEFDIDLTEVKRRLHISSKIPALERTELFRFTFLYVRSQVLIFRGKLMPEMARQNQISRSNENAYQILLSLAQREALSPHLRLMARLGAIQLRFRVGQFGLARGMLLRNARLLGRVRDRGLKAQFYVALAWSYQRSSSGGKSDRAVDTAINAAWAYAETTEDRIALGLIAHRMAGYFTKKGLHQEAVDHFAHALVTGLIAGNYEMVQASCGNIGSVIHRLGPEHYITARRWIMLGSAIARWMNIGRDDAHGELILAKIYIEQGHQLISELLLKRAYRVATRARNQVNIGDAQMVWGFWYQKFETSTTNLVNTLVRAMHTFKGIAEFDHIQKEHYMAEQFAEVWPMVLVIL